MENREPAAQWEVEPVRGIFGHPLPPRELVRMVVTVAILVTIFASGGLALAWMAYQKAPRAYQSTGTFVVDELPFVQKLQQVDAETDRQLVQTLILSIANREMQSAVVRRLDVPHGHIAFEGLDRPLPLKGGEPQANVSVTAVKNSRMGAITVESQDSAFAAQVVNAMLDELQLYNVVGGKLKALQTSTAFLKSQAESMLKQYVDVNAQRIKLEREKAEMENYLKQGLPISSFPAFAQDSTLNNLKTQLILVESEYKYLASTSTRGQRLEGKGMELQTLRAQLASQANNLAEGLRADFVIRRTQEEKLLADRQLAARQLEQLAQESTRLAQSFGDPILMKKLAAERPEEGAGPANMIVAVNRGSPSAQPFRPKAIFYLLLGGALGAMIGVGLAAISILLDNGLKSVQQIENQLGLPCLAVLSKSEPIALSALGGSSDHLPDYPAGLGFLRSHLLSLTEERGFSVIGFSPVSSRQRSSSLVADLAVLLAMSDKRTLVVDLHFEDPSISRMLGIDVQKGVEKWVDSDDPLPHYLRHSKLQGLAVLAVSKPDERLSKLISRRPLAAEWASLAADWDFVLIDAPCMLSDWRLSLSLPARSPLILTADFRKTRMEMLVQACSHARGPRWQVDGVVLTGAPRQIAG
jgi:capsular polysaccharide biosynthesis protein